MELTDFEALSSDCYGTLSDWETGIAAVLGPWAKRCELNLEQEQLFEAYAAHEARVELEHPTELYPHILARTFRPLGEELGVRVGDEDAAALARSVPEWPAFEDSHDALVLLGQRFKPIILSNVGPASFAGSGPRLGVEFTSVLTAEDVGLYKPSPQTSTRFWPCSIPRSCSARIEVPISRPGRYS